MTSIIFSAHARAQMGRRGATEQEVLETLQHGIEAEAKRGRKARVRDFAFGAVSPANAKFYARKQVTEFYVEEPETIIVVTVIVKYFN